MPLGEEMLLERSIKEGYSKKSLSYLY